jgi:hypothetical protein
MLQIMNHLLSVAFPVLLNRVTAMIFMGNKELIEPNPGLLDIAVVESSAARLVANAREFLRNLETDRLGP